MSTITISSQAQLDAALSKATGGETFLLTAGSYGVTLSNKKFTSPVTITSADASRPARIGFTKLTDVANLTFKSLDIGRSLGSSESVDASVMVRVQGGSNITYDNVHVYGSMDGDARNDGSGFLVNNVNGFKLINSELEQLGRGGNFNGSQNLTIANNTVHNIRSDGFDFAAVQNVLVDNNRFTDFQRVSSDHPDAIQFWTANTSSPSTDILIRNNVVLQGDGNGVQGIFLRDDKGGLPYERVTIQNNFIVGSNMANGIAVLGGKSINVTGNTVISPTDDATKVWIRLEQVSGGSITKNVADQIWNAGTNVSESGNLLTSAAGFSSSLLTTSRIASISVYSFLKSGVGYQVTTSGGSVTSPTPTPTPTVTPTPTPTPTPTAVVSPTPTPTPTSTAGKVIKSQSELDTALAAAKGGETLLLAAGTYGLSLYNKAYASTVTIASLDAANPAKIGYTKLSNVSNLTLKSLDLGRASGTSDHMVRVVGGSNIKFDSVFVHGSLDGNKYNDGLGFVVDSGAKNISIVNSRLEQLNYVGQFNGVNGLTLAGNTLKDIRSSTAYVLNNVTSLVQSSASIASPTLTPTPTPTATAVVSPTPTPTATPTVGKVIKSQSELDTALASAKGGETLLLAAGSYGLSLYNKAYASTVTIASLDAANPAKIGYAKLSNVSNLTFKSLDLGRASGTSDHMVRIIGGGNIKFDSVFVHGSLDSNMYNDGLGFVVDSGAKNISIVNSRFEQLNYVGQFNGVNGLTLAGNSLKDIRSSTAYVLNNVTNLVQSSTASGLSTQKIALAPTTYTTSSFAPASLSDTLALSEPVVTQSSPTVSTSATAFTRTSTSTLQRTSRLSASRVKTAADATISSSLSSQRMYQLVVGQ